jgi:Domain of unknown function (DUF4160)
MPTVLRIGPYRFFFYSADAPEPPHIHIERDDVIAKFWLSPVRLAASGGMTANELRRVEGLVEANAEMLLERWNEYSNA